MKIFLKTLGISILVLLATNTIAQEGNLQALHDEAKGLMSEYRFSRAREVYAKLLSFEPDNPVYNYETGVCIYKGSFDKASAIPYLEKAYDNKNEDTPHEVFYYLGKAYQFDHNFTFAIAAYTTFLNYVSNGPSGAALREEVERYIDQSEKGRVQVEEASYMLFDRSDPNDRNTSKYYMDQNRYVELLNAGNLVNTKYSEYGPILLDDNKTLIFTSRNDKSTGGKIYYDDEYYEDIYVSKKEGDEWTEPVKIDDSDVFGGKLNNTDRHDATVAKSPSGDKFYTYYNNHIQVTEQDDNGNWLPTRELSQEIARPGSQVSSIFPAPSGKRIYLVSNKAGGIGGRDIYYSDKGIDGKWGPMINLGAEVNTPVDESSPFLPNDSTLYFASKGHSSIGGYDIFITKFKNGVWSEPENLNIPINTPFNEIDYRISPDRSFAYYASDRSEGYGKFDIYTIKQGYDAAMDSAVVAEMLRIARENGDSLTEEELAEVAKSKQVAYSEKSGIIFLDSDDPSAEFEEIEYEQDEGEITFAIQDEAFSDAEITDEAKQNVSKFREEDFSSTSTSSTSEATGMTASGASGLQAQGQDEFGTFLFEERAHFQFDKSYLTEYSSNRIQKVIDFINSYPNKQFTIRIAGHTDSKGSASYNLKLTQQRAEKVKQYLVENGVRGTIEVNYYGESKPIISEETEDNSIYNRRVQVRLYSK